MDEMRLGVHIPEAVSYRASDDPEVSGAIRILSLTCVYPNPRESGRGLFVRSRLQQLAEVAQVKVVAPIWATEKNIPTQSIDERLEVLYPRWMYVPGTGAATAFLLFLQLIGPLRHLRNDFAFQVLDAHFGYPEGIAAALLSSALHVPFTVTLRGSELLHSRYAPRRFLMSWALRRASRVIAVSEQLRQFALELGTDPRKTRTIPNGIDLQAFFPQDRNATRLKHGLPLEQRVVLSAGHLIELKGHHYAIHAVKGLVDQGLPVQLLIAGGHPGRGVPSYEPELRRLIADLGMDNHVRLLGPIPQEALVELMSAADVFCLASSREGWPNVVHEALACGTPVVATRVGAVAELLPRELYGFTVPPNDPASLADALRRALASTWNTSEISAWGSSRSWEQVGREVRDEMVQVISESRAGRRGMKRT